MFCRDKSWTLLAKYGYSVVRLPRTGIEPLDVFGRDRNGIERLGRLPAIWASDETVPHSQGSDVAAEIKTVTTASLKTSIGLRVLDDILSGFGAVVPRLDFAYNRNRTLQFSFGNIQITKVDPFDVGRYLKKGDLQRGNPWVDRYFFDDDADAFVITEVLKSDSVIVIASSDDSTATALDVKAIQAAVGTDVSVEVGTSNQSEITYKGQSHLTFGFKAFEISYDFDENGVGVWGVKGVNPNRKDVYLASPQKETQAILLAERDGRVGRVHLK